MCTGEPQQALGQLWLRAVSRRLRCQQLWTVDPREETKSWGQRTRWEKKRPLRNQVGGAMTWIQVLLSLLLLLLGLEQLPPLLAALIATILPEQSVKLPSLG